MSSDEKTYQQPKEDLGERALAIRNLGLLMAAHKRGGREEARKVWAELFPDETEPSRAPESGSKPSDRL